jgi:hypothetical protein
MAGHGVAGVPEPAGAQRAAGRCAQQLAASRQGATRSSSCCWRMSACASCWPCAPASRWTTQAAEVLYDAPTPTPQGRDRPRPAAWRVTLAPGDRRARACWARSRGSTGHQRGDAGHRQAMQAIPVLNTRTQHRGVAFGDPSNHRRLELRFMAGPTPTCKPATSCRPAGLDGVYPPGVPVAKVNAWSAAATRPLPASCCNRWPTRCAVPTCDGAAAGVGQIAPARGLRPPTPQMPPPRRSGRSQP